MLLVFTSGAHDNYSFDGVYEGSENYNLDTQVKAYWDVHGPELIKSFCLSESNFPLPIFPKIDSKMYLRSFKTNATQEEKYVGEIVQQHYDLCKSIEKQRNEFFFSRHPEYAINKEKKTYNTYNNHKKIGSNHYEFVLKKDIAAGLITPIKYKNIHSDWGS